MRRLPGKHAQGGYVLLIALILLTVGALYAVVSQLDALGQRNIRDEVTERALQQAKEALIGYAATYRDDPAHVNEVFGYLPCPDTNGDGAAEGSCGSGDQAIVGLLPYKTLGLPDLRDSDGVCLWYAVSGSFKNNPKAAATVLNWDTQGQFAVTGTPVAPNSGDGGAAAVIFAAGPPITGQSRSASNAGPCQIDPTQVANYLDAGNAFTPATGNISLAQGAAGSSTNNDRVVVITPREIFDRVAKRVDFSNPLAATPPGHINTLIDEIRSSLEVKIQNDLENGTSQTNCSTGTLTSLPGNCALYTQYPGNPGYKWVGDLTTGLVVSNGAYTNYLTNWADQFRQVISSTLTTNLTINGTPCRGGLLFGGQNLGGQPRTTVQKTPSTANLSDYFEPGSGLDIFGSTTNAFSGAAAYGAGAPSADVGTCLFPGTFTSLKQDAAAFSSGTVTPSAGGAPVAAVTGVGTSDPVIGLGSTSPYARSGCIWYPTPLSLNTNMRLYFTFKFTAAGTSAPGFALALADAATNDPFNTNPVMCGAPKGTRLGYAGAPVSGQATVGGVGTATISSLSWASTGLATIGTDAPHGFKRNDIAAITGAYPFGYNGSCTVTSPISVSATSTTFSCAIPTDPGLPMAGIAPPKIALAFDTHSDSSRNDPSGQHFGFLYWGSAGDNNPYSSSVSAPASSLPRRDGDDDSTLTDGIAGDGGQPLNPRSLSITSATATPVATIAAAQWSSNTATITTSAPHGIANGQRIVISDITPLGYKGSYIASVTGPTTLTVAIPSSAYPWIYPYVAAATAATWSSTNGGTATLTTAAPHGLTIGQTLTATVSNLSPPTWNGTYALTATDATHLTYPLATSPTISNIAWSSAGGGTASVTTPNAHGLTTGQTIAIAGASPVGYNGNFEIVVIDSTHFTYPLTTSPGVFSSGGSIALGYGGQVSYRISSISAASWASGTVTVTTSAIHGLTTNQIIVVSGASPAAYNGTYRITSIIDYTHFTFARVANPGAYASGAQVSIAGVTSTLIPATSTALAGASWSSSNSQVTITTAAAHGLTSGQTVYVSGAIPSGYNGAYVATVTNATQFTFPAVYDPGVYISGGVVAIGTPTSSTISSASWSSANGGEVAVTTAGAHGLIAGQLVSIANISPGGYNGLYPVTAIDSSTTFRYALAGDPGGTFQSYVRPGIATIKTSDLFLPYTSITAPLLTTDIHVRLDVARTYDSVRHQARVSLRAYIGDTFDISGNCLYADFHNLSRDLSTLCPLRTPTVEQSGIIVNDAGGPAFSNFYLGFTNSRGNSTTNDQSVEIRNLILRSQ